MMRTKLTMGTKSLCSWLCSLLLLMAVSTEAFGQTMTVRGVVSAASDGGTLPGVTVSVKNTTRGTFTNTEGRYELSVNAGDVLVFSFVISALSPT